MGLDDSVFDCAYDIAENKEDKNAINICWLVT